MAASLEYLQGVVVCLIVGWYGWSALKMFLAVRPPVAEDLREAVYPLVSADEVLDIHLFLSNHRNYPFQNDRLDQIAPGSFHAGKISVPYSASGYSDFLKNQTQTVKEGFYIYSLDPTSYWHHDIQIPTELRKDAPVWLVAAPARHNETKPFFHPTLIKLSKHLDYPPKERRQSTRFLLQDLWAPQTTSSMPIVQPLHCIPPRLLVGFVVEHRPLSRKKLIERGLNSSIVENHIWYQIHLNSLVSPRDEYEPLHVSTQPPETTKTNDKSELRVRVTYTPISFAGWNLQSFLENALHRMETQWNLPSYDVDSLRMLIGGAKPLLSGFTLLISVLHLIFEFLAVTSELKFWRQRTSFVEFSASSLQLEIINEIIITAYLVDCGESKLVQYALAVHVALNLWKLSKLEEGFGLLKYFKRRKVKVEDSEQSDEERERVAKAEELAAFELKGLKTLMLILSPFVIAFAIYQLIYVEHKSWYSWAVKSMALCAYTVGFLAMTPQLFRNYKLKSVDHLPWQVLSYQAVNTFIDDAFSMIIRMPNMHRAGVFRDDVVFVAFHIQRWMYRKPKSSQKGSDAAEAKDKPTILDESTIARNEKSEDAVLRERKKRDTHT